MQLPIIAMNFIYAILGVVLMYATYRVIDMLTPQVDFHDELKPELVSGILDGYRGRAQAESKAPHA